MAHHLVKHFKLRANLSTSAVVFKTVPKDVKGTSSNFWISRQINDPYVKWAKIKNYRARSAFKLLEIDAKYHILKPGYHVIECGAAPGAWTQVCVERINSDLRDPQKPKGRIMGFDINHIDPVPGAEVFSSMDLTRQETHEKIIKLMNRTRANLVLSDMAPSTTGIKMLDHEVSLQLVYAAFKLALTTLNVGGSFVVKLLEGGNEKKLETDLLKYFSVVKLIKPSASRKESPEIYFLARKFQRVTSVT